MNGSGLATALAVGVAAITATCVEPPDNTWANEPAGYARLTDLDFSVPIPSGGDNPYTDGWGINQDNLITNQTDPTAPFTPQNVAQYSYPVGFSGSGISPGNMYRPMPYDGYYVGFWWKYSNPWQFHSSGTNKIAFLNAPVASNLILFMDNSRHIILQDIAVANYGPNVTTTTLTAGVWHKIEIWLDATGGKAKIWVDGVFNSNYTGINLPSQFTYFEFDPTWGGTGGVPKGEQDYYWYGQVHISHK